MIMGNKSILDIGSIISDINAGTASKIGWGFPEKSINEYGAEKQDPQNVEYEDKGPIGEYEVTYQELYHLLENVKKKWAAEDLEQNLSNTYYKRDLLYLYDRITLDMSYLNEYPDRNGEWLEKLLELKYEIRNLL